jgi:hypothetical protein
VTVKRRDTKNPSHTQDTREDTVLNQSGNTYLGLTTDVVSFVSPTTDLFPLPTVPTAGPSNPILDFGAARRLQMIVLYAHADTS